jgi:hypothetical protein
LTMEKAACCYRSQGHMADGLWHIAGDQRFLLDHAISQYAISS